MIFYISKLHDHGEKGAIPILTTRWGQRPSKHGGARFNRMNCHCVYVRCRTVTVKPSHMGLKVLYENLCACGTWSTL